MVKAESNGAGKSYGAKLDKVLQWDPMGLTNLNGCPPITHSAVMALTGHLSGSQNANPYLYCCL